jgi:hypothetical protein
MTGRVRYDAMCRAIDEAPMRSTRVKKFRDQAIALETYASKVKNIEAERRACEIRLRAERKTEKAKGSPGNQYTGPVARDDRSNPRARRPVAPADRRCATVN